MVFVSQGVNLTFHEISDMGYKISLVVIGYFIMITIKLYNRTNIDNFDIKFKKIWYDPKMNSRVKVDNYLIWSYKTRCNRLVFEINLTFMHP